MIAQLEVSDAAPGRVINVARDQGHPWDGRPGFDLMTIEVDTEDQRDAAVKQAQKKFWAVWISGFSIGEDGRPSAVLYKPCGITAPWIDFPDRPHPGCRDGVELPSAPEPERQRG